MTGFPDLGLSAPILSALTSEGYAEPTPIQRQAIQVLRDVMRVCVERQRAFAAEAQRQSDRP